ncbi:MAG TPA: hypothetical protein VK112_07600, partial [Fodinibius sp.]|nr:hypothetical protein [Fodinibius sp.]
MNKQNRNRKHFPLVLVMMAAILLQSLPAAGQNRSEDLIEAKVDSVLNLMTLEEKVGQMTLFTSDLATTGPTIRDDYVKLIKEGKVG